jgi:hypothetical protein
MSMDLESAGALATATLVAKEIDGNAGKTHAAHAHAQCANCNAPLAGAYCHRCGQAAHVHRSLLHMVEEGIHGVLHFDTKSWRTLPLLIGRPGLLTRRYIEGQRVRYVSPLALFLFSVFLLFFVFSLLGSKESPEKTAASLQEARKEQTQEVEEARKLVAQRTAELAQANTADDKEDAAEELSEAQDDLKGSEVALAALDAASTTSAKGQPTNDAEVSLTATNAALDKAHLDSRYPKLARTVRHAADNPELTLYKMKSSAYKFAFMLVPLSLPFLWLMFWRRKGVTMYDHAIFTLYSLSFMSLWSALIGLMATNRFTQGLVSVAALFMPIHMFVQLKEAYRLGWFSTAWRTIALLIADSVIVALFVLLIVFISLN